MGQPVWTQVMVWPWPEDETQPAALPKCETCGYTVSVEEWRRIERDDSLAGVSHSWPLTPETEPVVHEIRPEGEPVTHADIRHEMENALLNDEGPDVVRAQWRGEEIRALTMNGQGNYGTACLTEEGLTGLWEAAGLNYEISDDGDGEWSAHAIIYVDGKTLTHDLASGGPALDWQTFQTFKEEAEQLGDAATGGVAEIVGAKVLDWYEQRSGAVTPDILTGEPV